MNAKPSETAGALSPNAVGQPDVDERQTVRLAPIPPSASQARRFVAELAIHFGFHPEDVGDIEVATGEAMTNAIEHGQWDDRVSAANDLAITVTAGRLGDKFVIVVIDSGPGFTPGTVRSAAASDKFAIRGRGIEIMAALMDEMTLERTPTGMAVRMARALPRHGQSASAG